MAYPEKLLNDGEEIVLDLRPHWWQVAPQTALLVLVLILGISLLTRDLWEIVNIVLALGILASLVWAGLAYAQWLNTNFVVTSDRVIYRYGVLSKNGIEIPISRVNTVRFNQSVFERMLGAGDLVIESASAEGQSDFSNVRKPELVQNAIHRQFEMSQRPERPVASAPPVAEPQTSPPAAGGSMSVTDELTKLSDLHERGVLSDAEFEQQKRRLLD